MTEAVLTDLEGGGEVVAWPFAPARVHARMPREMHVVDRTDDPNHRPKRVRGPPPTRLSLGFDQATQLPECYIVIWDGQRFSIESADGAVLEFKAAPYQYE